MGYVYKWTSPSGKGYVGGSKRDKRHRKNEHKSNASGCFALKHAIQKYGINNMKYEILVDDIPLEDLDRVEQEMQDLHRTLKPNGYNMMKVGQFKDKYASSRKHQARCAEVMGSERMLKRKRELWQEDEFRGKQLVSRREAQGGAEHVAGRRAVFEAKRNERFAGMAEPDRMVHAEFARRDAVQGARKTIRKGSMAANRDPMAEVVAVYGDGSEWQQWKAQYPGEAKEAMARNPASRSPTLSDAS